VLVRRKAIAQGKGDERIHYDSLDAGVIEENNIARRRQRRQRRLVPPTSVWCSIAQRRFQFSSCRAFALSGAVAHQTAPNVGKDGL
jgi:hypothetical protein